MLERTITLHHTHRILFTRDGFDALNPTLTDLLALGATAESRRPKVIVFIDDSVAHGNPGLVGQIERYAELNSSAFQLAAKPILLRGGEGCKNDFSRVEQCWAAINDAGIDRHSYVFAIGGGAVLDLVGFAASTAHRGIRHIRFPTTTLSQGDGGVGVKNGVNFREKKNWIGTFAVPFAIINDFAFLDSLPERDRRNGIIEAIKVALIRDASFYTEIENMAERLAALEASALERIVQRSAEEHVSHIATSGDPFELGSALPLGLPIASAKRCRAIACHRTPKGFATEQRQHGAIPAALPSLHSIGFLQVVGNAQIACRRTPNASRKSSHWAYDATPSIPLSD